MSFSGNLLALDQSRNKELNLGVLKRLDPAAEEVR